MRAFEIWNICLYMNFLLFVYFHNWNLNRINPITANLHKFYNIKFTSYLEYGALTMKWRTCPHIIQFQSIFLLMNIDWNNQQCYLTLSKALARTNLPWKNPCCFTSHRARKRNSVMIDSNNFSKWLLMSVPVQKNLILEF